MAEHPSGNIASFFEKVSDSFIFDGNPKAFTKGHHFVKITLLMKKIQFYFQKKKKKELEERAVYTSASFHPSYGLVFIHLTVSHVVYHYPLPGISQR